jgi:SWI/SNF-related matrix-associated actin-dependent regulator of chromatin subfamily A3
MATHVTDTPPRLSSLPLAPMSYSQNNAIDLTLDDDDDRHGFPNPERQRIQHSSFSIPSLPAVNLVNPFLRHKTSSPSPLSNGDPQNPQVSYVIPHPKPVQDISSPPMSSLHKSHSNSLPNIYRPAFSGSSVPSTFVPSPAPARLVAAQSDPHIIDLTGSPSPPPSLSHTPTGFPVDLPPKTPVCIGQLTVTALILYPVAYLQQRDPGNEADWVAVRFQYEHNPNKPGGSETIHIKAPHSRGPTGEVIAGEGFGVVEQKVATSLGPMLGKGLIRLDGKVRKGMPNVSRLLAILIHRACSSFSSLPAPYSPTSGACLHSQRKYPCGRKLSPTIWPPSRSPLCTIRHPATG